MNTIENIVEGLQKTLDHMAECPEMFGSLETLEFRALNTWSLLESCYNPEVHEERLMDRWGTFVLRTYPIGCWFLHTYLQKNYPEEKDQYRRLVKEMKGFRQYLRLENVGPEPLDQAKIFRAGLEAAASVLDKKAAFHEGEIKHLATTKEVPEDLKEDIKVNLTEAMWDAKHQASNLRLQPVPENLHTAGETAVQAIRTHFEVWRAQLEDHMEMVRSRANRKDSENKDLKTQVRNLQALLREAQAVCVTHHVPGTLISRINKSLV